MALTICTRNETNKDGSVLLHVRFKTKEFDKKIPTKIKVIKKHWDSRNKRLKPNHPYYGLVNKKLKELSKTVDELYDQNTFAVLTYEEARTRLLGGSHLNDVISYMDQHLKNQLRETTFKSYRQILGSIAKHFNGTKKVTFEELCNKNNWLKLKDKFNELQRSPASFNAYRRSAKAIHNHAVKDDITFTSFSFVRSAASQNLEPKWMRSDELIKVISGLDVKDNNFELSVTSILTYLMMFSMRGLYVQDVLLLSMDKFVDSTYENSKRFSFGEKEMVYKHNRSKTNKMGLVFIGLDPIKEIIFLLNNMIDPTCKSIFPIGGDKDVTFWRKQAHRFKVITGHPFKSVRKAFQTTGSILSVPDSDMRELMYQNDLTITSHYKDTQAPQMLEKYTKYHSDILEKYRVNDMFKMLKDKLLHHS
jgi:hypothetical protein